MTWNVLEVSSYWYTLLQRAFLYLPRKIKCLDMKRIIDHLVILLYTFLSDTLSPNGTALPKTIENSCDLMIAYKNHLNV
jgi:hypothetical protein